MNIKTIAYLIGIFLILGTFGYFMLGEGNNTGNIVKASSNINSENVQEIIIGMKDFNYYPNTITVKAGQPVSISLDNTVQGCFRDFTIREFGIRKYMQNPTDTVTFTPTKPGTYTFACSMGMGRGTLIVE